jgi:hypothetical protein
VQDVCPLCCRPAQELCSVDVTLGLVVGLVRPARVLLLYMAFWGLLTATIRPLAGEPIWEFVERVPDGAVPLAFFDVRGLGNPGPSCLTCERTAVDWLLRVAAAGALVGHGAILAKASWLGYSAVSGPRPLVNDPRPHGPPDGCIDGCAADGGNRAGDSPP